MGLSVLRGAPALTSLSLTDDPRLTVDSLHTIAQVLAPTLRSLTLDGCAHVWRWTHILFHVKQRTFRTAKRGLLDSWIGKVMLACGVDQRFMKCLPK